jgi:peptide/nickel transport system substrate-binding protein
MVHAGLSLVDDRGSLRPQLAEAVPSLENGLWVLFPDGRMQTTWRIRSGARWHDGALFTSEDLAFTARVSQDREVAIFGSIAFGSVEAIEAPDPFTVVVTWKQPYIDAGALFSRRLAMPMAKHLLERAFSDDKASFVELPYWSTEFVGAGPFRVRELVRGSHLLVSANEQYVLGRPKIDDVEVRYILDLNAMIASVLAGSLDVTLGKTITLEQGLQVRDQWKEGRLDIAPANAIQIYPQFLNPSPPVVANVQFRRALVHAVDRQQLVDTLLAGMTSVAHGWLSPVDPPEYHKAIEASLVRYPYDPRRAAQLIEELGYGRAADGMVQDAGGQRLVVELRTTTDNDVQIHSQLAVADHWQRVGVGVEPITVPPQRAQDLPYRATFPAFEILRGQSDLRTLTTIHSRAARLPENNFRGVGGTNYPRYLNPEFDALIERYFSTIPLGPRLELAGQILHHMTDQLVIMTMLWDLEPSLISNRLANVAARQKDSSNAWNAHLWDVIR